MSYGITDEGDSGRSCSLMGSDGTAERKVGR